MRLPRMRITTGTLILLVAVMAGNFGALRFLVTQYRNTHREEGLVGLVEPLLGFLPLVNIALIGSVVYAFRWIRSSRLRGESARVSSSPSALTYFCIHFLLIGFLFAVFIPDKFESYRRLTIGPIREFESRVWPVDSLNTTSIPTLALGATLAAIVFSGPTLILAGIGRRLARRYAASVPRRRFRMMTGLVSFGFAAAALAIVVFPQPFEHDDDEVVLSFRIVDKVSSQPIRSAFVRLTDPFPFHADATPPSAFTDADGRAQLIGHLPVKGERNLFRSMGVVSTWGRWLEVSAPGHQTVRLALPEVLTPTLDLEIPAFGLVALAKGETPEPRFRDLAGMFSTPSTGFGGTGIVIVPDGRFVWESSGCTYRAQEYGYVKWDGEEITLISIADPGREAHFAMTFKYRTITWGDSLYFSSTQAHELQSFCRAALAPRRHKFLRKPLVMMREESPERPQVGLPRLPAKVWVGFALGEINPWNEDGALRLALQSIIPLNLLGGRHQPEEDFLAALQEVDRLAGVSEPTPGK